MADTPSAAPDRPEFSHVVELAALHGAVEFDIAPDPAEIAALARLMELTALRKMRLTGRLMPVDAEGWQFEGKLGATVVQPCVVTLEPVTTRIDQPVRRRYLPVSGAAAGAGDSGEVGIDEDDEIEPLAERIDLGLLATEALALALPAYPRKEGATLRGADADEAAEDDVVKPFAALSALRDKLGGGS